jgi:hypothetical protein
MKNTGAADAAAASGDQNVFRGGFLVAHVRCPT